MNLLVITGSDRDGSFNVRLRDLALDLLGDDVSVTHDAHLFDLPFYRDALDNDADRPQVVRDFDAQIEAADAVLIVTPEYNGGPPAQVKNAVDWSSRPRENAPIAGKRVVLIGASPSPGGTQRAREALVLSLKITGADVVADTVGVAKAHEALVDGLPTDTEADLRALLEQLQAVAF